MSDELFGIHVKFDGSRLEQFQFRARMVEWADRVGPEMRAELQHEAPVGDPETDEHSGRLRRAIRYRRITTPLGVRVEWTVDVPYASYVIGGTQPHEIHATAAMALRFRGPGDYVFRGTVMHPGSAANNFVARATENRRAWVRETFNDAMRGGQQ